jgi:type IV pilus assembly protein PilN
MIKINLLPKEARKRVGLGEQIFIIVVVLILNFAGIGFYWRYLNGIIEQKQEEIARTNQRLADLQKVIDEIKKFEQQRAALERKLQIIAKLEKEQQVPVHLLDNLYLTLVDDMWLRSFQQSGNNLAIQGSALSNPVVANYLRSLDKPKNLGKSPYFDNVELIVSQIRRVGTREIRDFQVTATLTVPQEPSGGTPNQ